MDEIGRALGVAFDEAFSVLERRLERDAERARQSRRRPKKYYVAKRLLSGGAEGLKRSGRAH